MPIKSIVISSKEASYWLIANILMPNNEENYERARKKVVKMKRFYKHLSTWMITSVFLMLLFFFLRLPPWITLVVVGGWGLGLAGEALEVFGFPGMDKDWEERKIREELRKMEREDDEFVDEPDAEGAPLDLPELRREEKKWNDSDLV